MAFTPVFIKEEAGTKAISVDLSSILVAGELALSAVLVSTSPSSTIPLTISSIVVAPSTIAATLSGGNTGVTYGIRLDVSTNLPRTFSVTLAVQVLTSVNVPYVTRNPFAFQNLIGNLPAGEAAIGKAVFVLPPAFDASSGYVNWEILDANGVVYSAGNAYDFNITSTSFATVVEANGVINLPSTVPPTLDNQSYQLRWSLNITGQSKQYVFESLQVPSNVTTPLGAVDVVELKGDPASFSLTLAQPYDNVGYEIYFGNTRLSTFSPTTSPARVSTGWHYSGAITTTSLVADLVPYNVSWKYWNSATPGQVFRETAKMFLLTSTMLIALEDVRMQVMKARTTLLGFNDTLFDTPTIISWLRRGRDMFNGAAGVLTNFDFSEASGGVREFWLRYSEVAMLRAQALAEGEKAFDFQGQAISLSVDKAQYYTQLADTLQSQLDNDARPFKLALKTSGIHGGDGNMDKARSWNVPILGIAVTPASSLIRGTGYRLW